MLISSCRKTSYKHITSDNKLNIKQLIRSLEISSDIMFQKAFQKAFSAVCNKVSSEHLRHRKLCIRIIIITINIV